MAKFKFLKNKHFESARSDQPQRVSLLKKKKQMEFGLLVESASNGNYKRQSQYKPDEHEENLPLGNMIDLESNISSQQPRQITRPNSIRSFSESAQIQRQAFPSSLGLYNPQPGYGTQSIDYNLYNDDRTHRLSNPQFYDRRPSYNYFEDKQEKPAEKSSILKTVGKIALGAALTYGFAQLGGFGMIASGISSASNYVKDSQIGQNVSKMYDKYTEYDKHVESKRRYDMGMLNRAIEDAKHAVMGKPSVVEKGYLEILTDKIF